MSEIFTIRTPFLYCIPIVMRGVKPLILTLFLLLNGHFDGYSQGNSPKYSNEFLTLGVGGRAFGLGSIGVSTANDVTASYWNPAGLLDIESDHQAMFMHSSYFGGIANYDFGAFATRILDSSRLAVSVLRFSVDDIPDTRFLFDANGAIDYSRIRFFSASDYAFLISYAQNLRYWKGIKVGGNLKVIHRLVGSFSKAWGFGIDLGARKKLGKWQLGLSVRDVFGTFNAWNHNADQFREVFNATGNDVPLNTVEVSLPRIIVGGSRKFDFLDHYSIMGVIELVLTTDGKRNTVIRTNPFSIDPIAGVELGYKEIVFLRFGAGQFQKVTELTGEEDWKYQPSAGLGFKIRELTIDYALTDIGDQAEGLYSHIFSLKVDFYGKDK